jgi:SAM-dependent MidA family methyltransferase
VASAAEEVRRAVAAAGGAVPFSEFHRLALYGPTGFYTRAGGGRAGRRGGAFLTSPEVGPLFGAVIARYLDARWDDLDRVEPFTVVDVGAGPGTLARTILAARPRCAAALRYIAVEISANQQALHPPGIESRHDLPDGPLDGVIVANELLDNLPFRLCVFDGGWREGFVTVTAGGDFAEVLTAPLDPTPPVLPASPPHGSRAALYDAAVDWVDRARSRLGGGRVLVFDFARHSTAALALQPWRQWLRTYRGHGRGGHYLADAGDQDITVEVALDQLATVRHPDRVTTQADFLTRHGIDELVETGRRIWAERAHLGDLEAVRGRSRAGEAAALTDPAGLGGFQVIEWLDGAGNLG